VSRESRITRIEIKAINRTIRSAEVGDGRDNDDKDCEENSYDDKDCEGNGYDDKDSDDKDCEENGYNDKNYGGNGYADKDYDNKDCEGNGHNDRGYDGNIASRICSAFEIDMKEFLRNRSRHLLILGFLDEVEKGFGHLEVEQVLILLQNSLFHNLSLWQYLARLPGCGKQETLFIYQQMKLICFRKAALELMNDRMQKRIISEALPIRESPKMHVILGYFDSAYSEVLAVKGAEKRIRLFIYSVWLPAILHGHNRKSLVKFFLE
jgi:hypothetical protein